MSVADLPKETYRQTVGLLGDALGIGPWDTASRKGLRDFVCSEDVRSYATDAITAYLRNLNPQSPFPSILKVMRAAMKYYSPSLVPNCSINKANLAYGSEKVRRGEIQRWADEYLIALFAARVVYRMETSLIHLAPEEMAWFPVRYHHKIAFAVALLYFLFLRQKQEPLPLPTHYLLKRASMEAVGYLQRCHRCTRCGQDFVDPKASTVCSVCPTLEEGEIVEFERLKEQNFRLEGKLKSEVDDFFDFFEEGLVAPSEMVTDVPSCSDPDETAWPL